MFHSIIATIFSIFLPNYFVNQQRKKDNRYNHISLIFDHLLLEELPVFLSNLFECDLNQKLSTTESQANCDEISNILIKVKNISIIYYIGDNMDSHKELKELILNADELLTCIPDNNCKDPSLQVDLFKKYITDIYKLIYDNDIV